MKSETMSKKELSEMLVCTACLVRKIIRYLYLEETTLLDDDEPILMVAAIPGQPIQIVTEKEAEQILPCFNEDDEIIDAFDTGLVMSYDRRHLLKLGDEEYLIGPAILYALDDEGDPVPLDAIDIRNAKGCIDGRTVSLCADGADLLAIQLSDFPAFQA